MTKPTLKICHTADWHLEEKNVEEVTAALERLCDHVEAERPDLIVVAGDLTHSQVLRFDTHAARTSVGIVTRLAKTAPVVICVGTPSHDGMAPMIHGALETRHPVLVADRPMAVVLTTGMAGASFQMVDIHAALGGLPLEIPCDPDVFVSIIPAPTKAHFRSDDGIEATDRIIADALGGLFLGFAAARCRLARDTPHVHVGHYQVDGCSVSETQTLTGVDIAVSRDQLRSLEADLIALGHIHKAQRIAANLPCFYSGSPVGLNFGELDDKGFYLHTVGRGRCDSRFVPTGARKRRVKEFNFLESPPGEEPLRNAFPAEEIAGHHLRIRVTLWADEVRLINQSAVEAWFAEAGAYSFKLEMLRKPRKTVRAQRILEVPSLAEKITEMAAIRGHEKPGPSLLDKAARVETLERDELLKQVRGERAWS